jgi:hypothetical protein
MSERLQGPPSCDKCGKPLAIDDEHVCVTAPEQRPSRLGWWTIYGGDLLAALRRVQGGDDPDLVYAELYANTRADRHRP